VESPIRSIRFIHTAIRKECESLEEAVTEFDPRDEVKGEDLRRRFTFLHRTVKTHEDGEEDAIFPAADNRIYPVSAPYLLDHRVDQAHIKEIGESLSGLAARASEHAAIARQLYHRMVVVNSAITLHMRKEEEIVVPLLEQHFSVEEQKGMVGQAMAHFGPDLMPEVAPWLVRWLEPEDQEAFLRMMMSQMPPQLFAAAKVWVANGVPKEMWQEIVRRIPEAA
jgi:hemerythrin-like domain-containing protein